jgi:hexosaminidase
MKYCPTLKSIFLKLCCFLFFLPLITCRPEKDSQQSENQSLGIVPLPVSIEFLEGTLSIDKNIVMIRNDSFPHADKIIEGALNQVLTDGYNVKASMSDSPKIVFKTDNRLSDESYRVVVSEKGITIYAGTQAGAFYASQSIRQMLWKVSNGQKQAVIKIRYLAIEDGPKYIWRGFHIDVSRHFFTKEYIMKTIDWLALYKFNKLQLHLTDDQGWRVEIDQFPLLTEKGAWRIFDNNDSICMKRAKTDYRYEIDSRFIKEDNGITLYGGYYTKNDLKEIIAYAASNFIDIIPEIDMPGHMSAAISAYPYLSCTGNAGWGKEFSFPICPCNDETMDFCYRVWDEITDLFPDSVVHIGSDEVEKDTWAASPECQSFMSAHNLPDIKGIQNYFVNQLQKYLEAKGKTVIAWDDVIEGKVNDKLVLMYWRDWISSEPASLALNGNKIILTPWTLFYLSGNDTDSSFKKLYAFSPSANYSPRTLSNVIGFQGCVWTEHIPSEKMFEYHVYPGMQALSEVAWTDTRDWGSFVSRLKPQLQYMDSQNIGYREPHLSK